MLKHVKIAFSASELAGAWISRSLASIPSIDVQMCGNDSQPLKKF